MVSSSPPATRTSAALPPSPHPDRPRSRSSSGDAEPSPSLRQQRRSSALSSPAPLLEAAVDLLVLQQLRSPQRCRGSGREAAPDRRREV
ncbi:hypothetical protein Anapl_03389 [Anas platyrhynchos]|uniref:Uncharacterized protein n=1 Tax=Anas platyrhynchos TaxID=8839 RepID=R0L382_ANAPL|nr:hypothetical protein Anapl_03389 [Anas platyrhynchos]